MKKSAYYAIGIGTALAVIVVIIGLSYQDLISNPDDDSESIGSDDSVTVSVEPTEEPEGKEIQINVSDGIESQEGP